MKNEGFTLIELLAVIVILAVVALIAVPIVINIINSAKESSNKRSIESYAKAILQAVSHKQLFDVQTSLEGTYETTDGKILNKDQAELKVEYDGPKIVCDVYYITPNGSVYLSGCNIGKSSKKYSYGEEPKVMLLSGKLRQVGSKYRVKVNNNTAYNFYLLSVENSKVNLIMDRNICNNGTVEYTSSNNYCRYAWHESEKNNNYGPDTAMTYLYNATSSWTNIPDMIMDYKDENNQDSTEIGYVGIKTDKDTKVTTITGKNGASNTSIGNSTTPLKARLPKQSEVVQAGCKLYDASQVNYGSCPEWLVENSIYYNVTSYQGYDKYKDRNNNETYQQIYGYYLLASSPNDLTIARRVIYQGVVGNHPTSGANNYGIRPVITLSISDLSN